MVEVEAMGAAIVQSWPLYNVMFFGHWLVLIAGPILLWKSGHPILAGFSTIVATIMPLAGQAWFTDSDAPGLAFLLFLEAPIAVIVFIAGLAAGMLNLRRRLRGG